MSNVRQQYPFHLIEAKWQRLWDQHQVFRAWNPGETLPPGHPFAQRHGLEGQTPGAGQMPPKFYVLDMFPYPSGAGLHVGHPEGYTATDILARYRRACGYNVLHPLGWDAFGLPAEQYAIKTGQHPRQTTEANIANFKRQIKSLGFSYDWSREVDTTDPGYFKWTQWIFLQIYNSWFNPETNRAEPLSTLTYPPELQLPSEGTSPNLGESASISETPGVRQPLSTPELEAKRRAYRDSKRLAYVSDAPVNWCPELGTVLANEEVIEGKSEVGGFPVVRRPMRQWMLRITAYAEKLLQDLDSIDWSDSLKEMQRNWIGRSEGAEVDFNIAGNPEAPEEKCIRVFTTRPDTLFGATYMVLSPEHSLVDQIVPEAWPPNTPEGWKGQDPSATHNPRSAIAAYRAFAASKSDLERTELAKEKTGVFTGAYALNPVSQERIPIWIADYVLISYGTGAIMAVPAHDTRDYEFALKFDLPIIQVVQPPDPKTDWRGFVDDGVSVNSTGAEVSITGLSTRAAKNKITVWLESQGLGKKTINYKLRDWLFSRQRYWGEPFPIVWKDGQHEALPESALPLVPPPLTDYKPTSSGEPPLARAKEWVNLPDGSRRETNTMPQWAGSCWYYLRYLEAKNPDHFVRPEVEKYWMGAAGTSARQSAHTNYPPRPGVDLYVGGTEHAVLHLLYARFWHKVLYDLGHVSTPEPFYKLVNQGLILGEMEYTLFLDSQNQPCSAAQVRDISEEATGQGRQLIGFHKATGEKVTGKRLTEEEVEKSGNSFVLRAQPDIRVDARCFKMSKSRGNVINPDEVLKDYGADAFRLYEMFMGPLEMVKPWSTKGVEGVYRFLGRVWRLFVDEKSEQAFEQNLTASPQAGDSLLEGLQLRAEIQDVPPAPAGLKILHACIKKVTEDLNGLRFNTAISALMVFVNEATGWAAKPVSVLRTFLQLLQPFAPHLAEELHVRLSVHLGQRPAATMAYEAWPVFDPAQLEENIVELPIQVNGKLRGRIQVPADASAAQIEATALASDQVKPFLEGKTIKKIIVVPRKVVNLAVS